MCLHEKDPDIYIENRVVITCLSNIDPKVKKIIFYFSDLTVLKLCTFFSQDKCKWNVAAVQWLFLSLSLMASIVLADLAAWPMASFRFPTFLCPSRSCTIAEEGSTADRKV